MTTSVKNVFLSLMGLLSLYFYYIAYYPLHREGDKHFLVYVIIFLFLYGSYKGLQHVSSLKKISFNVLHLIGVFVLQIVLLSGLLFTWTGGGFFSGFILGSKVIFILFFISLLWLLFYVLGSQFLSFCKKWIHIENTAVRVLASLTLGCSFYVFFLFLLGILGMYSISAILLGVVIASLLFYKKIFAIFSSLKNPLKQYDTSSQAGSLALFFDEIHYILVTFLLSVNFISVYRPFPIGWDDLGVYMNFPKLLSSAGELLPLGQMYFWQLYTGVGFLAGSQTYAFFLNSFSGIFVALAVYIGINSFRENKKNTVDFGLLGVLILLMMPMTVFQLAKDMKLDFALLGVSITALVLLYHTFFNQNHFSHKKSFGVLGLVGFFVGVAFSIKVTSLLLLVAILGALSYKKLKIWGFFGFFSMFVGVFTLLNLWKMMNVITPENIPLFIPLLFLLSGGGMIIFSALQKLRSPKVLSHYFVELMCIIMGFVLAIMPWTLKHIGELSTGGEITSISQIINGRAERFTPDYSNIYSDRELTEIQKNARLGLDTSGTTNNEDFGRYFGYEKGINNYLKIPFNLTFQTNQKGEFTDITFLFFALLPVLFIFLPFKKKIYQIPVIIVTILLLAYYIPSPFSVLLSQLFSQIFIPYGYFVIAVFIFAPVIYLSATLDRSHKYVDVFLVHYAAMSVYVLLWLVSAFGVVWYGIVMYFGFLLMIALILQILSEQKRLSSQVSIYIVLTLVWVYALASALPHGVTNLKTAGYTAYKLGDVSEEQSLMKFHPDYYTILWEVNISDDGKKQLIKEYKKSTLGIISSVPELQRIESVLGQVQTADQLKSLLQQIQRNAPSLSSKIDSLLDEMYHDVIFPDLHVQSEKNIYRAGTFMKYFISRNNARLYEDNLLSNYQNYIQDTNGDISIERFQKLGIDYILLDLNAATIDNDARKNLTKRYENMLTFLKHKKLEMIATDSVCLRVALDLEKVSPGYPSYLQIAGTNYDDGTLNRSQKKYFCAQKIVEITKNKELLEKNFSYLTRYGLENLKKTPLFAQVQQQLKSRVPENEITDELVQTQLISTYTPIGYKVLMKVGEY